MPRDVADMHKAVNLVDFERAVIDAFPNARHAELLNFESEKINDIELSIKSIFMNRRWSTISMHDWRMTGVTMNLIMLYVSPHFLLYYLPSLLLKSIDSDDFEYVIDFLSPIVKKNNKNNFIWYNFKDLLTEHQRFVVRMFLEIINNSTKLDEFYRDRAKLALDFKFFY